MATRSACAESSRQRGRAAAVLGAGPATADPVDAMKELRWGLRSASPSARMLEVLNVNRLRRPQMEGYAGQQFVESICIAGAA